MSTVNALLQSKLNGRACPFLYIISMRTNKGDNSWHTPCSCSAAITEYEYGTKTGVKSGAMRVLPIPKLGQLSTHLFSLLETTVAISQGRIAFDTVVTVTMSPPPPPLIFFSSSLSSLTAAATAAAAAPTLSSVLVLAAAAAVVTTAAVDDIAA